MPESAAQKVREVDSVDDTGTDDTASVPVEEPAAVAAPEPARSVLRPTNAADSHAVILTAEGTFLPSGVKVAGPVDDISKLTRLIDWLFSSKRLLPRGSSPQVWLIGQKIYEDLGWWVDTSDMVATTAEQERAQVLDQLSARVHDSLASMLLDGWELRGEPGHRVHLTRNLGRGRRLVDLVLEAYAWTISAEAKDFGILGDGEDLPDDDMSAAAEISRRIAWSVEHLGVLPGPTSTRTAADVADQISQARRTGKTRGAVVDTAGPVPVLDGQLHGELEPRVRWARTLDSDDTEGVDRIITVDQRASYLASAGSDVFGWGEPLFVPAGAERHARADKLPYGLWRVTLPAADSLTLPEKLPLPHPHMQHDTPVCTWVTSVSLEALTAPVADGGTGLDLDDLELDEAWLWPNQGRALEAWATRLRKARAFAVETGDAAMKRHVGDIYKRYIGRMLNPGQWQASNKQHHHQPVWRATIMASSRWRSRRAAMQIAARTGRWPIHAFADALTYLAGPDEQIADPSPYLGKLVREKQAAVTGEQLGEFAAAADANELRALVEAALGDEKGAK
ncbi:hypothetical protein GS491_23695 [Rhodococcus hoagii]|nr:hypothetical protein [Prescottella equi]MBM4654188.1 hypothetical protein [Prescottella equi]MBM4719662.1 hypothetical protein [Prescottella equi]NKR23459.1 hypothetical protein [Prescottella equi]NKR80199.1 hypothetical protein [Prescottella equi]